MTNFILWQRLNTSVWDMVEGAAGGSLLDMEWYRVYRYHGTAEVFTPGSNSWACSGCMGKPRQPHIAVLLPRGKVLVGGDLGNKSAPAAEISNCRVSGGKPRMRGFLFAPLTTPPRTPTSWSGDPPMRSRASPKVACPRRPASSSAHTGTRRSW